MGRKLGYNITFPIYNEDGTPFHDLVIRKSSMESVVMSLGDKIVGDVYYPTNTLVVTMKEYIEYKRNPDDVNEEPVKYRLINPPTIVREGIRGENGDLKGMTKYSFEFYHPMTDLGNIPFTDVAVSADEKRYKSQDKTFSWIGTCFDFIAKLNKNLDSTEWVVIASDNAESVAKMGELSEVLSFDKNTIADALKTGYDTWEVPFVIDALKEGEYFFLDSNNQQVDYYSVAGGSKRFVILFGLPSNEIYASAQDKANNNPFIFRFGQGLGLKNNSRTPKNNKIVTRVAPYGSEDNIPYGYPQIRWYGDQTWTNTKNDATDPTAYPIYEGILGGQYVKLIKHPFTRNHLMPSIYAQTIFDKVSPYSPRVLPDGAIVPNRNYDSDKEIIDYYDATQGEAYPNPINLRAPSYETHEFEKVKPELGAAELEEVLAYDTPDHEHGVNMTSSEFNALLVEDISISKSEEEIKRLQYIRDYYMIVENQVSSVMENGAYIWMFYIKKLDEYYTEVKYESSGIAFHCKVLRGAEPVPIWDDSIDDEGNYKQGYFKLVLPILDFDLYACASITQEMSINMRSGACIGCTFQVQVDWDDYKRNFYHEDGTFDPEPHTTEGDGHVRDISKYPNSSLNTVTLIVKKDTETFGTLMPNTYQRPHSGDEFVILGISLPETYITNAEHRLDLDSKEWLRENNVYYHEYPLKFDEEFLREHEYILAQMRNNTILRFAFGNDDSFALYIKEMSIKYGEGVLPQYDITLTDDVEIVLNQIGQTTEDVSRLRLDVNELHRYYDKNFIEELKSKLSKTSDDVAEGRITFQQGFESVAKAIFRNGIASPDFVSGLYNGTGWKIDELGNAEMQSLRVRAFLEVVELIINRLQAQEGDTIFTDNDQIEYVEEGYSQSLGDYFYILTLKDKWNGYVTSQKVDNILKGIINTLAAKDGGVSDVTAGQSVEVDGQNKYYTSWMVVIDPQYAMDSQGQPITIGQNQIVVRLWGDNEGVPAGVPAGVNFKPCEFMTVTRWGCLGNAQDPSLTPTQKADIERRQRIFYISTTDGRISKLRGVNQPILTEANYGTTLGIVPDFIENWSIASRLVPARDYLYAQGVIVGDFIKVDINGDVLVNYVDCGEWIDGSVGTPSVGAGIYLCDEYNEVSLQQETHDVWHKGAKWRCLQHQPMATMSGDIYAEPVEDSPYWEKLLASAEDVRPNLLRQTSFEGLDKWFTADGSIISEDYEGRNAFQGTNDSASAYKDFLQQQVYMGAIGNIVEPNTVYTLSFYAKGNANLEVYLYPSLVKSNSRTIIDGVEQTAGTSSATFTLTNTYVFHTITFRTAATLNAGQYILFRIAAGLNDTASICMPKLERGNSATAYMENEADLRGKIGRNPYYWGTWEDFIADPTNTFMVTDAETPYFAKLTSGGTQRAYWVFVGDNSPSGGYSASDVGAPSSSNRNWEIMVTDFKYLISEAIFSAFAKLGAAIFNEDFMYSQWGYQNDFEVQDEWQDFNPQNPDDDSYFNPNVYINWRKGDAHFGAGKTYFHRDGSGHLANGNISWDADGNAQFEGDIQAHSGIFSGFLKKTATLITSTNLTEYLEDTTIAQRKTFNLDKGGSFLVFEPQWYVGSGLSGVDIEIPSLKIPTAYSSSDLSSIAYVGTILILVAHGDQIPIKLFVKADTYGGSVFLNPKTGVTSKELWLQSLSQADPTYGKDSITFLECKMNDNYGVYWEYRQINITKPI